MHTSETTALRESNTYSDKIHLFQFQKELGRKGPSQDQAAQASSGELTKGFPCPLPHPLAIALCRFLSPPAPSSLYLYLSDIPFHLSICLSPSTSPLRVCVCM